MYNSFDQERIYSAFLKTVNKKTKHIKKGTFKKKFY